MNIAQEIKLYLENCVFSKIPQMENNAVRGFFYDFKCADTAVPCAVQFHQIIPKINLENINLCILET